MKANNFISQVNHLVKTNRHIIWQGVKICISILFASFPLYFINFSAQLWFIPMTGVSLFMFALVGEEYLFSRFMARKENLFNRDYDNLKAVFVTEFGKQNTASNHILKTVA